MTPRRKTRKVMAGPVGIGGDAPVALQTMTSTYTYEIDKTIDEIQRIAVNPLPRPTPNWTGCKS